jgi:ParB family chromosome partitioning protein
MAKKHGLGRGLGALIRESADAGTEGRQAGPVIVAADDIRKNRWQPRRSMQEEGLSELAESIREHGVLQPLLVRAAETGYELIAGERRLRAARAAGLKDVPVILMEAADNDVLELALVENVQREDLNVMEEAEAYGVLADTFGLTQEQIAQRVGKARASITNTMRLMGLPEDVKQMVAARALSPGHAKALTGLDIAQEQSLLAKRAAAEGLSVRQLEKLVRRAKRAPRKPRASRDDVPKSHLQHLSDRLHAHFGTSVRVRSSRTFANGKKGKGTVEIDFYSNEDLDRILDVLGLTEE